MIVYDGCKKCGKSTRQLQEGKQNTPTFKQTCLVCGVLVMLGGQRIN